MRSPASGTAERRVAGTWPRATSAARMLSSLQGTLQSGREISEGENALVRDLLAESSCDLLYY
ncbi:hypothetical protein CBOM_01137 [Ceraceosorus bombacis]|uniref:Uncharacterized protein n=1 Tax=Ceraceosorus bombacis TaxID=401625 RepID=A0A0P1BBX9_9BASI|nr:hypothetical protein CBOM_01137 [Ceraceosorus bombacis]